MYFGDVVIHGVHMFFGDAEITVYRVTGINSETVTAQQKQEPTLLIHNHFYYELHLMTADTTCFLVDGKEIHVDVGSLLVIEPEVNHFPFHRGENADEIVFALTVKQRSGENGFYEYFTSSLHAIANCAYPLSETLFHQMCDFHALADSTGVREVCEKTMMAHTITLQLFDQINGFDASVVSSEERSKEEEQRVILEFLINDAHCPITVMADKLGYSTRHVARLIRRIYGKSLAEIRTSSYLTTAKQLLGQSPYLSMNTIAEQAGFCSAEAMRKAFLRTEYMTPTEYRKTRIAKK